MAKPVAVSNVGVPVSPQAVTLITQYPADVALMVQVMTLLVAGLMA
jgi:hypothetical protein